MPNKCPNCGRALILMAEDGSGLCIDCFVKELQKRAGGPCNHPIIAGDNYGSSCQVCGAQISGFGYGGDGNGQCIHVFAPVGDEPQHAEYQICIYCEEGLYAAPDWPKAQPPNIQPPGSS